MRVTYRTALACLLIGMAVNYLIAIFFALVVQSAPQNGSPSPRSTAAARAVELWYARHSEGAGLLGYRARHIEIASVHVLIAPCGGERYEMLHHVEAGWPWHSARSTKWIEETTVRRDASGCLQFFDASAVPLIPIWAGLGRNLVLFAGIPFLIVSIRRAFIEWCRYAARRQERLLRCCPSCQYDLRGDLATGCPECGWNRVGVASVDRVSA